MRGVADYLLFGPDAYKDNQNYEERLEEVYRKFEKAVQKYDQSATPELLDLGNDVSSETASVYMESAFQTGILRMLDLLKNVNPDKENT